MSETHFSKRKEKIQYIYQKYVILDYLYCKQMFHQTKLAYPTGARGLMKLEKHL